MFQHLQMKLLSDLLSNNHRLEDIVHFWGVGGKSTFTTWSFQETSHTSQEIHEQ